MVINVKPAPTVKTFFNPTQIATAMMSAPDIAVHDPENPPTTPDNWDNAVTSRSLSELRTKIANRQQHNLQSA